MKSIKRLEKHHMSDMLILIENQYHEEEQMVQSLPPFKDLKEAISKSLTSFFDHMEGFGIFDEKRLIAFMMGYEMDTFWGNQKGVLVPLFGHGSIKENRKKHIQMLYQYMAQIWVNQGWISHAVKIHGHDQDSIDAWFELGFGNRCFDAIKNVKTDVIENRNILIKKASINDMDLLLKMKKDFGQFFKSSPIFMSGSDVNPGQEIKEWLSKDNHHQWIAYKDGKPIGMIKIEPEGETLVSRIEGMMNITGIYVVEEERQNGIGQYLLSYLDQWLTKHHYSRCGVDYESFNTLGANFWKKNFQIYTRTLSRRIDEQILEKNV
jgi:GNAT superfamily N-acetyltransferase